jgi:sterol desaturase/sphingolipid hydroxylase (fatty acid hydroxylase superfamily)
MTFDLIVGLSVLIALLVLETTLPFYRGRSQLLRHGVRNGSLALINGITAIAAAPLLALAAAASEYYQIGLLHWLRAPSFSNALLVGAVAVLSLDLWMYLWHRANHQFRLLWRFHQVHHTDPAMDATTALRFHPGEFLLSSLLIPIVVLVLGIGLTELTLYKALMLTVILLHHSNVALPDHVEAQLRRLIVPPSMHRVHHSRIPSETDSNYGSIFSFWDRLFGTYRIRRDVASIEFGTGHRDGASWQSLPKLLRMPLLPSPRPKGRAAAIPKTSRDLSPAA